MKIITDDGEEFTIEHVRFADIREGDLVILRHPKAISEAARQRLVHAFEELIPGVRVAVLEESLEIEILRKAREGADVESKS